MNAFSRLLSVALCSTFIAVPVAIAAPVEGFVATLTVARDDGTVVGRYDLLNPSPQRALRQAAPLTAEEPEPADDDEVKDASFAVFDDGLQLIGDVHFKIDPFVQFAFGIGNFSNTALNYFFVFATPYTGGPYNELTASLSSSVTDGGNRPNGSVTVDPFTADVVVDGTAYITLNSPCQRTGAPGFSLTCPEAMGGASLFSAVTGLLSLELSFRLSPQDLVSVNGRADLLRTDVSEPTVLAVLSIGLVALVAMRRRASAQARRATSLLKVR